MLVPLPRTGAQSSLPPAQHTARRTPGNTHLMGRTQGTHMGQFNTVDTKTTGCTEEGPWSPLQLGSGGGRQGERAASHRLPGFSETHSVLLG